MYSDAAAEAESESERNRMSCGADEEEQGSFKSLAKQTEQSYQLQLALALRLSSHASASSDHSSSPAQTLSHRFWVYCYLMKIAVSVCTSRIMFRFINVKIDLSSYYLDLGFLCYVVDGFLCFVFVDLGILRWKPNSTGFSSI